MLDLETRRRIDTARDILVGKVPDPKSQVEQITFALIYKFMDDMDAEAEELGGERAFFTGEFARYRWPVLLHSGLGGHETLNRYEEAIRRMGRNDGLPPLFRDIFDNAALPYRDPATLREFLRVIDRFEYDHSERLGDAFEYLLSIMGAQGDAGQFRTPRHLIDFIVAVLDPQKHESVLDPACGTAGFLVSAWKHVRAAAAGADGAGALTPDERARIADGFRGYDISPDMVRLSRVNLYLHGFARPAVHEYDTLTSDERWNERADVILANPPFMSPRGGIRPHARFSIDSKRSEALFVDYIAEHLNPGGRAGVIVPEGVVFQRQKAYRQLRRLLLDECLVAVVSLPAGVFKPYSGVKTSILLLDRALARHADGVAFLRIANDGFGLGDQRRPIEGGQLERARAEIAEYLRRLRAGESPDGWDSELGWIVPRERIATDANCDLSGERYRANQSHDSAYPRLPLKEVCQLVRGVTYRKDDEIEGNGHQVLRANNIALEKADLDLSEIKLVSSDLDFPDTKRLMKEDVFICIASGSKDHIGKVAFIREDTNYYFGGFMGAIRSDTEKIIPAYLFYQLRNQRFNDFLRDRIVGANINNLSSAILYEFEIPLPPLDVQREIVAEIEGYQRVIDGARAVVEHYRPRVPVDPDWPLVALGSVIDTVTPPAKIPAHSFGEEGRYPIIDQSQDDIAGRTDDESALVDGSEGLVIFGDHTCAVKFVDYPFAQGADGIKIIRTNGGLLPRFAYFHLLSYPIAQNGYKRHFRELKESRIPLPPLETQRAIVAELEAERALVESSRELMARMDGRIEAAVARVWGGGGEGAS